MHEQLKIFVDRLKGGGVYSLDELCSTDFMDLNDAEIKMGETLSCKGEAYLADSELIVHLDISTTVFMPCAICNEAVEVPIHLKGIYLNQRLDRLKSGVYDLSSPLREEILLSLPRTAECEGSCPRREEYKKYFVSENEE